MRILMIAYTFPPVSGISPARVARLAAALVNRGHRVKVLCADRPPRYPEDSDSLALLCEGIETIRVKPGLFGGRNSGAAAKTGHSSPGGIGYARFYRRLLKPLVFPDATFPWILPARSVLRGLISSFQPERVYSFAYPFSSHLLGAYAARLSGARWIMDYGDPWSLNPMWEVPSLRKWLDGIVEKRLLQRAHAVVVTTEATRRAFQDAFSPIPPGGLHISRCGLDHSFFESVRGEKKSEDVFRIVYTGTYGMANRGLGELLEALSGFAGRHWELHLAGIDQSGPGRLKRRIAELGLSGKVVERGMLPLRQALSLQKSADLLLLFGWRGGLQIPAKVYEYLAVGRPILLIRGDARDPAAELVEAGPSGICCDSDPFALRKHIGRILDDWHSGTWPGKFQKVNTEEFSWDRQIAVIVDVLESGAHETPF